MEEELTGKGIDLPPEIMHDILSRLPAKPLCRFKLVSKSWLSLISDTKFIIMHSKAVETNQSVLFQRRRVLISDQELRKHYSFDLDHYLDMANNNNAYRQRVTPLEFQRHERPFRHDTPIQCPLSCNGLLLIETTPSRWEFWNREHYLFNPLGMKEPKQLPYPPSNSLSSDGQSFGLGFDYFTNEHKVVNLGFTVFGNYGLEFYVYTLKTDSWRVAGDVDLPYKPMTKRRHGVLVNGCVHWLIYSYNVINLPMMIFGFTVREEKIVTIPLPETLVGLFIETMELGVFRDWLCITFPKLYLNEFWVMKEYGVEESWTKMRIGIPYYSLTHSGFRRESYDLLMINTGYESFLVMYDFDDKKFWTVPISSRGEEFRCGSVCVHVESLASVIASSKSSRKRKKELEN